MLGNKKINNLQKLTDISLENISGGKLPLELDCGLGMFGAVSAPVGMLGGIAFSIAGSFCSSKSHSAIQKGDTKNAEKYAKTAKGLTITSAVFSSIVPVGIGAMAIGCIDGVSNHPEIVQATQKVMSKLTNSKQP